MSNTDDVRIVPFDAHYANTFAELNYQWIEEFFVTEEHDREMLDDPIGQIIGRGGEIFFAIAEGKAVGTVALIDESEERFELAKMAVGPSYQGRGIGGRLMLACIEYSRAKGKARIYLLSNIKLEPAIALYRKHGFVETLRDERSTYERVNIRMELALNTSKL